MPSPRRKAVPFTGGADLSVAALAAMSWPELVKLAEAGRISWSDVRAAVEERIRLRGGDPHRWDHLEPLGSDGRPRYD